MTATPRLRVHRQVLASALGLALLASGAARADEPVKFEIPSQPLVSALRAFTTQSKMQLLYEQDAVRHAKGNAVVGDFEKREALEKLLQGTGVEVTFSGDNAATIRVKPKAGAANQSISSGVQLAQATSPVAGEGQDEVSKNLQETKRNEGGPSVTFSEVTEMSTIVVTGTRIRGITPVGAPVRSIDRDEVERSGYDTTEALIQSVPQNFRGGAAGAAPDSSFGVTSSISSNYSFGSGVNFRGLGNTATLVLVNGHRVPSSDAGFYTDISSIPLSAVERVDVLTDGASAIYGSDAIAGVLNLVLRREGDGLEMGVRYGQTTERGFSSSGAYAILGGRWDGGGFTVAGDLSKQSAFDVIKRDFTSSVAAPTSIFPKSEQAAFSFAGHHNVLPDVDIHADAQYVSRSTEAFNSVSAQTFRNTPNLDRWSASGGTTWDISESWSASLEFSGGQSRTESTAFAFTLPLPTFSERTMLESIFSEQTLSASGNLFSLPVGAVRMAIGASHREEEFQQNYRSPTRSLDYSVGRDINAAYVEFLVPVSGQDSPLGKVLLSLAGRYNDYSDFGETTNPKFGFSWEPIPGFTFRGAYSTSFRAPSAGTELVNSQTGTTGALLLGAPGPGGGQNVPIVFLVGAQPGLGPETAKNITFGLDVVPREIPSLRVSLNYYDIQYSDQLANAPFIVDPLNTASVAPAVMQFPNGAPVQALVAAAQANGAVFLDITGGVFGANPLASAVYIYDLRTRNLSETSTNGFDLSIAYNWIIGSDKIDARLDATYITEFESRLTATSPAIERVDTVGYPADFRLRAQTTWTHHNFDLTVAVNYVDSYLDNSSPTSRQVDSYETFDLVARYRFGGRFTATLNVINLFDEAPPFVFASSPTVPGSHYDPANANPAGRFIGLSLTKQW